MSFEEQLYKLRDDEEVVDGVITIEGNGILKNIIQLEKLLIKIIDTVTIKKELLVEDMDLVELKQKECIDLMREILKYMEH